MSPPRRRRSTLGGYGGVESRGKLRSGPGGGLMGTAVNILSVLDIASDVSKKDYASAGIKGSLLVVGTKVPGVGEALFGVAVILKSRDPALRNISMSIGESVEDYTGSHVVGALAAAGVARRDHGRSHRGRNGLGVGAL